MSGSTHVKGAAQVAPMPSVSVFAVGKRGYTYGAANLAASIAHYAPDVKVNLYTDGASLKYLKDAHRQAFSDIVLIEQGDYTTEGKLDPGKMKCRIAGLVGRETLYVDADSVAVKDIRPMLLALQADGRDYITEVIEHYLPWASEAKVRAKVKDHNAKVLPIQSSWAFIRPSPFFDSVRSISDDGLWSREELDSKWGKSMPDELMYTTACAISGVDPSWKKPEMLFGNKIGPNTIAEVRDSYSFLTLYGNGAGRPHVRGIYIDMYDRILHDVFKANLMNHSFKSNYILGDKYLN